MLEKNPEIVCWNFLENGLIFFVDLDSSDCWTISSYWKLSEKCKKETHSIELTLPDRHYSPETFDQDA